MSNRQYPCISACRKIKHPARKIAGKCPCGAPALYDVIVQTSWFRGDDEREKRCESHKDKGSIPVVMNPPIPLP